jgi:4-carboxymuconolactone decarboxylase
MSASDPFDIDARQAQVVGERPRIEPLDPSEFDPEARKLAVSIRESLGLTDHSNMPEVFAIMLKHPDLYQCQIKMGIQLYQGALPARDRELAVLRVGWLCRAPYEWGQHVDIAKRCGISDREIERVTQSSAAPGWSAHDAAILRGVEELLGEQMISDATWRQLAKTWSERQLIEFPTLVGQYVATAYSQNALRVRLPEELKDGLRHR